jgi:hypothetical protein
MFLDRHRGHLSLDQFERGSFVTKAHIDQRKIANQRIVFWLLFEERFRFAAGLPPIFLGCGMVAGDFLRPP